MGTVKYSGPVASFHCPTEATIRSLKVHFSPKQLGEGTPSPENVREIVGWDGVVAEKSGKNLWGGSAMKEAIANNFPVISTDNNIITYSNSGAGQADGAILFSSFKPNTQYTLVLTYSKSTNVYTHIAFLYSDGSFTMHNRVAQDNPNTKTTEVYVSNANKTLTAIVRKADEYSNVTLYCDESGLFEGIITKSEFEPYRGEKVDYKFGVLGKNKFNKDAEPLMTGAYVDYSSVVGEPIRTYSHQNYKIYKIPITPNTIYTFGTIKANDPCWALTDANNNVTHVAHNNGGTSGTTVTFTAGQNDYYLLLSVGFQSTYKCDDVLQLELGSTATTYEPYDPNHTVYGGWVDLISGEVQQEWAHVVIDENTSFYIATRQNNSGNYFYKEFNNEPDKQCLYTAGKLSESKQVEKSNQFEIQNSWGEANINKFSTWAYANADTKTTIRFGFPSELNITSVDTAKSWFMENGSLEIVYPLVTSISYSLAPTSLQTFLGQNNVWSNADYVEVEYDLHETQTILARKQFIIANQPHIVKPAAAPLQNFVTDLAAPLKECKIHFSPVQEGTGDPSPDNVRPISGWTGVKVYHGYEYLSNVQITTGKTLNASGLEATESGMVVTDYIPVEIGHTYTLKFTSTTAGRTRRIFGYSASKEPTNQLASVSWATVGNTFSMNAEIPSGTSYIRACYYNNDISKTLTEPSVVTTLPIDWTTEAGTIYGGYVDLVTGEVWTTIGSTVFDGTQPIKYFKWQTKTYTSGVLYDPACTPGIMITPQTQIQPYLMSDKLEAKHYNAVPSADYMCFGAYYNTQYGIVMKLPVEVVVDTETINAYLAENPVTIIYTLAAPVLITTLTPTQLKTLRGTNNIWSTANENIELSYWTH